jgi:hypothetical protein
MDARLRSHRLYTADPQAAAARRRRRSVLGVLGLAGVVGAGVAVQVARERYEAARRPAAIQLDIQPAGEVWVDGKFKGNSPPLTRLWLPPGDHQIELRHGRLKPVIFELQLEAGEELEVKHVFTQPAAPQRRRREPQREPSLLDRIRSWSK